IAPAPRGVPQIEVAFDIDSNGIVSVSAKDLGTQKQQSMVVTGRHKLDKDQIDRMMKEAKEYEEQDKKVKEKVELRNQADDLIYQTEKLLSENGDKIPDDLKANIEEKSKELKQALEEDNVGKIKIVKDELQQEIMKVGQYIYQNQNPGATTGTTNPGDNPEN
ncbi:MAG: Hsp70 family protein, partial [Thermotogota bacterium]|nr:Hsp70 family protein [Thermotogota bacterium]